jgi:hypothetical protein
MIKNAITIKDLSNSHLHAKFNEVVTLFRELSLATGLGADVLILEEFGTTLVQLDWTDETGWFVTYRLHPMYSHMTKMLEASLQAQSRFASICANKDFKVVRADEHDRNTRITVYVKTGKHSIGD